MSYVDPSGTESSRLETNSQTSSKPRSRRSNRRPHAQQILSRACRPVLGLEGLEPRQLLAVLPAPNISGHTDISGGGDNVNQSSPSIAYNPSNPQKLVTVYTSDQPSASGFQKVFVEGRYSINAGATWESFSIPNNLVNPTISPPFELQIPYTQATDATVGFDLNDNFYISYSEHQNDYSSGAIVLQKFSFAQEEPELDSTVQNNVLYQ